MPRARIPHARVLASADSPFLSLPPPFLAPRLLHAAPFPPPSRTASAKPSAAATACAHAQQKKEQDSFCPRRSHGASGLIGLRYAHISAFAHQQTRRYATDSTPLVRGVDSLPQMSRTSRARRVPKVLSRVPTASLHRPPPRSAPDVIRKVPSKTKTPTSATSHDERLMNLRRRRALATERRRLDIMLSYEPDTGDAALMQMGRYRTLQRRLYNYSRTNPTVLDMGRPDEPLQSSRLLFRAFAGVARNLYPGARRSSHAIKINHDPRTKLWLSHIFRETGIQEEEPVWNNWMALEQGLRQTSWPRMLLYLVDRKPDRALQFLRVIARDPSLEVNPPILADTLEILARRYIKGEMQGTSKKSTFVPTFCHIFRQYLADTKPVCTQDLLLSIARLAHAEDLKLVYHLIEDKVFWGYDTLLHWANTFGKLGEHKYALFCLEKIVRIGNSSAGKQDLVARERFRWSCALILRESVSNGQNYHMTADIVAQFLKLGVKLDILLYNVIMSNAMEAGDYSVAFRVFSLLEENGVQPDKKTYSILLHGCSVAENPPMFRDFAERCQKKALEWQDPWLASDCLYYEYICHHNHSEDMEQVYSILHRTYSKFFAHERLEWISAGYNRTTQRLAMQRELKSESETSDQGSLFEPQPLLEPPTVAIYIMLQTEIQRAMAISTRHVWDLYLRFRLVVRERQNPLILELARNPTVWNAFLFAFCKKQQFANASHLIKSMPSPNIYSWNIFMQAFFKTSQIQAAERVYHIMQTRDVQPDQFTFGVLLRGYARAQRAEKIGQVMERMDNEKQLHPAMLQALSRMRDRESLMRELEQGRLRKETAEKEKVEREEAEKRGRWELPRFKPLVSLSPRGDVEL
ncbi:hypothetical protein K505DRAFT_324572 [Melanomma pulvis-pyrius CBS 109.77]|uniref:Pentacotripeptide-repeat region of PRORP domain-containing protein n=1 Tax=Melanomma pulvis-pyrius CBS 109.77 TaxID=1314802 RepID=A0A6A6XE14_9PLEO|nr:hypothetical protein K505DRAFT_324572 [Melanomma pulvis-pyrius CBS 109.77]